MAGILITIVITLITVGWVGGKVAAIVGQGRRAASTMRQAGRLVREAGRQR